MTTITISHQSIQELIVKIRRDIHDLKVQGRVRNEDIKISIPVFHQVLLQEYLIPRFYWDKKSLKDLWGNFEIVKGYNNQVCVFNERARPGDFFLEPIQLVFDEK